MPRDPWIRGWLYQSTKLAVANSTSAVVLSGPSWNRLNINSNSPPQVRVHPDHGLVTRDAEWKYS